jgi:hypothetical protein
LSLQDESLVPSDAVHPGKADEHGMWKARRGKSIFHFSIPFTKQAEINLISTSVNSPEPYPSSYWNSKVGGIRYVVSA